MKRILPIGISLGILGLIYGRLNVGRIWSVFLDCHLGWLTVSLVMVIPLTMMTAWRLDQLMPGGIRLGVGESNRLILVACVYNLILPSKMGDLAKAWFMKERGHLSGELASALVIFEKGCDMIALLLWCGLGLLLYPQKDVLFWVMSGCVLSGLVCGATLLGSRTLASFLLRLGGQVLPVRMKPMLEKLGGAWREMYSYFWQHPSRLFLVVGNSIVIWFFHLVQIWVFVLALRAQAPFLASLALAPLAILAGLLPLTFAGVGTRDAALILFFRPYLDAPTGAALGMLCTLRYVLPALGGLPFVTRYMPGLRSAKGHM
jgi:glycosyltransferase 2 family protein